MAGRACRRCRFSSGWRDRRHTRSIIPRATFAASGGILGKDPDHTISPRSMEAVLVVTLKTVNGWCRQSDDEATGVLSCSTKQLSGTLIVRSPTRLSHDIADAGVQSRRRAPALAVPCWKRRQSAYSSSIGDCDEKTYRWQIDSDNRNDHAGELVTRAPEDFVDRLCIQM